MRFYLLNKSIRGKGLPFNFYFNYGIMLMFFVMFDDNAVVCETQLEAVELVDSLTLDGYRYISVGHNQPLNVDEMEEIEYDV